MSTEADIMALTFFHTCTIERVVKYKDGGFTRERLEPIYTDIPCAVSYGAGSNQGTGEEYQPIDDSEVLYTRPDIIVKAGDAVTAKIYDEIVKFEAGDGRVYPSHRQTQLRRKERA